MARNIAVMVACSAMLLATQALAQATNSFDRTIVTPERIKLFLDSAASETPKLAVQLLFLGFGWYIGKRLTVLWSRSQRKNEQDLIAAGNFHLLYGEFFSLWKLWNYHHVLGNAELKGGNRWELLDRAARAEAKLEATLVRVASERSLDRKQIDLLGQFRQLYQQLRECIRDNKPLNWDHSTHPEYTRFKELAPQVAAIIAGEKEPDSRALLEITSNKYENPRRPEPEWLTSPRSPHREET